MTVRKRQIEAPSELQKRGLMSEKNDSMQCPKCGKKFEDRATAVRHATYDCECGQQMDWDYICILPTGRLGQVRIGGVAPCEHADKKRPGSCEPIRISTSFPRPSFTDLRLHLLRQQRSVLSPFRSGIVQNELPVRV